MKKLLLILLVIVGLGVVIWWKQSNKVLLPNSSTGAVTPQTENSQQKDIEAIRTFMRDPNLELSFVSTSLPQPYFTVGKVTKLANGENIEKVDGWVRQVNVYDQKGILDGQCVTYEYYVDARNHTVTAVSIRGLRPNEIDSLKKEGVSCVSNSGNMPKITKAEAETIAMDYLGRALPNLDEIKDQFVYSQPVQGEVHQWLWENKSYKLPQGLEGRPYSYPTIRMIVNGDRTVTYWNTTSLFEN